MRSKTKSKSTSGCPGHDKLRVMTSRPTTSCTKWFLVAALTLGLPAATTALRLRTRATHNQNQNQNVDLNVDLGLDVASLVDHNSRSQHEQHHHNRQQQQQQLTATASDVEVASGFRKTRHRKQGKENPKSSKAKQDSSGSPESGVDAALSGHGPDRDVDPQTGSTGKEGQCNHGCFGHGKCNPTEKTCACEVSTS